MSRRGEEFESDFVLSSISDPAECDDLVADDDNSDDFEDYEDSNMVIGGKDYSGDSGGNREFVGKNFNTKKRKRMGGRQRLTQERIYRLDTIGFQWVISNSNAKSWEERFEELKQYQQCHGTTRVPRSSGTLGEWVHMQVVSRCCSLRAGVDTFLSPYLFFCSAQTYNKSSWDILLLAPPV